MEKCWGKEGFQGVGAKRSILHTTNNQNQKISVGQEQSIWTSLICIA